MALIILYYTVNLSWRKCSLTCIRQFQYFLPVVLRSLWRRPISEGGGGCTEAPEGASHPPYLTIRIRRAAMAPRKRGGGGRGGLSFIFCCFNGSDHPEITYRLREDFALQVMEPALPMPGYDELDSMFSELVVRNQTRRTNPLFFKSNTYVENGSWCISVVLVVKIHHFLSS